MLKRNNNKTSNEEKDMGAGRRNQAPSALDATMPTAQSAAKTGDDDMLLEIAEIEVKPGSEMEFEAAVAAATPLFKQSEGCLNMGLHRSIEFSSRYRLIVCWESLEAHTVGFRQSPAFDQWRALVSPHFAAPPKVEHVEKVFEGF